MKSCLVDWEYLRFAHFRRAAVTAGEVSAAAQAGGQVQRWYGRYQALTGCHILPRAGKYISCSQEDFYLQEVYWICRIPVPGTVPGWPDIRLSWIPEFRAIFFTYSKQFLDKNTFNRISGPEYPVHLYNYYLRRWSRRWTGRWRRRGAAPASPRWNSSLPPYQQPSAPPGTRTVCSVP